MSARPGTCRCPGRRRFRAVPPHVIDLAERRADATSMLITSIQGQLRCAPGSNGFESASCALRRGVWRCRNPEAEVRLRAARYGGGPSPGWPANRRSRVSGRRVREGCAEGDSDPHGTASPSSWRIRYAALDWCGSRERILCWCELQRAPATTLFAHVRTRSGRPGAVRALEWRSS